MMGDIEIPDELIDQLLGEYQGVGCVNSILLQIE